jgi:hypothetical protein
VKPIVEQQYQWKSHRSDKGYDASIVERSTVVLPAGDEARRDLARQAF